MNRTLSQKRRSADVYGIAPVAARHVQNNMFREDCSGQAGSGHVRQRLALLAQYFANLRQSCLQCQNI